MECFLLHVCSFSGIFNGGFARGRATEDFVRAAKNNAVRQSPLIQDVNFFESSYAELDIPAQSIIYCDPPYAGTAKYKAAGDFNHDEFWQWCRDKVAEGHQVFVSEYNAPDDFECVWSKEIQSGLNVNTTKKGVERLFVHSSQS